MSSSYFESLGRRESEPFTYDNLNYAETEPDLVEATNKQIDENIKDRKQFFQDNIDLYNMTMKARGQRWSDLAKLTKSGKEILDRRRTYKASENKWDGYTSAYEDENTRSEFIDNSILYEKENKEIKVEGSREVGRMQVTGRSSDNVSMKPTDIADFNLVIQAGDFDTGLQAVNEMNTHLPTYMGIAEESLMVNGKFYKDMSYSEKVHWRKVAYARYAEMWMAEHPEIRERDIITKFIPNVKGVERDWDKSASDLHVTSSNELASNYQTLGYINTIKAASANYHNGNEDASVHSLFSQDSYIQEKVAFYEGQGRGKDAYRLANNDWVKLITDNIGSFTEQEIRYLTKVHKFVPEGQSKETNYETIQGENVSKINNAWKTHKQQEVKTYLESELNALENLVDGGDFIDRDQILDYLAHPELAQRANALLERSDSNRSALNQTQFKLQRERLQKKVQNYVSDRGIFKQANDFDWKQGKYVAIMSKAEVFFNEKLNEYKEQNQGEASGRLAMKDTLAELDKGTWENENVTVYTSGNRGNDLQKGRQAYKDDYIKTVNSKEAYEWEKPYIQNAKDFFDKDKDVQLDGYWTQLAKDHPGVSPFKLAHDRLVAMGVMEANPRFGVRMNVSDESHKLLMTKTDFAKINRAILSSDEDMNTMLNEIQDPNTVKNGGIDAVKVDGRYVPPEESEVKLSEMTVGEILEKVQSGEISRDTELGIYGLKGDAFVDLFLHTDSLDLDRTFDQNTQTLLILERLRYKSNNRLLFRDSDMTYRRLVNVPEKDRESFKAIIGDLGPFMDLNTLLPIAATELVENKMK